MNKIKIVLPALFALAISSMLIIGCKKQELNPGNPSNNNPIGYKPDGPIVVYANMSCTTVGGQPGCECRVVTENDDCDSPTECTASTDLVNYNQLLHAMFTEQEIAERAKNKVRITEPALRQALKKDGFPVKSVIVNNQ